MQQKKNTLRCFSLFSLLLLFGNPLISQNFLFGADLSYANEMEDCGTVYQENNAPKDPYQIFADHNCDLVRLRLWHSPAWYDTLNSGQRYSDFQDVKKSISRAKAAGMQVLLDFHLSDNWADPGKQLVPAAWLNVVDDLPVLKDSLYNYIAATLLNLHGENLLPEMVQIGNETNKGILLSPDDNATWTLKWQRNAELFNRAIQAVRDVENTTAKEIKVALHMADPSNLIWMAGEFVNNGVTDFDVIGMSYYWAWHQPTSIEQTGEVIQQLKAIYPDKEIMVFETGYIWTTASNDGANNIISEVHPDYSPANPENQKAWLIDLTKTVMENGGTGVVYWEPAWVSSGCWTQWGQGSHQEHATFFDFENNLLGQGGIGWMTHDYATAAQSIKNKINLSFRVDQESGYLEILTEDIFFDSSFLFKLHDVNGRVLLSKNLGREKETKIKLPLLSPGLYIGSIYQKNKLMFSEKILVGR